MNPSLALAVALLGAAPAPADRPEVAAARRALAAQLHASPAGIELVSAEDVTWPNGSLGCPKPGMMYTQSVVPGYRVVLSTGGKTYEFHGRKGGPPQACPPRAPASRAPRGPLRVEDARIHDLRLVAAGKRDGAPVDYVLHPNGMLWEVAAGQRVQDGSVEGVEGDAIVFRMDGLTGKPLEVRRTLFDKGDPAARAFDAQYTGQPLSIDFDGDLASFVALVAKFSGLNIVLEAGVDGPVHVAARGAPWDGVVAGVLENGGFGYKVERGHLMRIGRRDELDALVPMPARTPEGEPITMTLRNAPMDDIVAVFRDLTHRSVEIPPGPQEPLTIHVTDVPWDEVWELIAASRGWTSTIDAEHVRAAAR